MFQEHRALLLSTCAFFFPQVIHIGAELQNNCVCTSSVLLDNSKLFSKLADPNYIPIRIPVFISMYIFANSCKLIEYNIFPDYCVQYGISCFVFFPSFSVMITNKTEYLSIFIGYSSLFSMICLFIGLPIFNEVMYFISYFFSCFIININSIQGFVL